MQNLDLDVASDFLLVASTLLEIKARKPVAARAYRAWRTTSPSWRPPRRATCWWSACWTYKQYKNAAAALHARFVAEGRMHRAPVRPRGVLPESHARLPDATFRLTRWRCLPPARWRGARCFCWKASTSPRSPSRWRCTCAPFISASANLKQLRFSQLIADECTPTAAGGGHVFGGARAVQALHGDAWSRSQLFGDIDIELHRGLGRAFAGRRRRADVGWGGSRCSRDLIRQAAARRHRGHAVRHRRAGRRHRAGRHAGGRPEAESSSALVDLREKLEARAARHPAARGGRRLAAVHASGLPRAWWRSTCCRGTRASFRRRLWKRLPSWRTCSPVTRAGVASVRGVNSDSSINSLVEKGLMREAGTGRCAGQPHAVRHHARASWRSSDCVR